MSTMWHDAVDTPRAYYTTQDARQKHWKHQSDSGQQFSSLPNISPKELKVSVLLYWRLCRRKTLHNWFPQFVSTERCWFPPAPK